MLQMTESGNVSDSIEPESDTDSLIDRPFSKSNPIMAGSLVSALVDGSETIIENKNAMVITKHLDLMMRWQSLLVMNPMYR